MTHTIDFRIDVKCERYLAKKLWEFLFRLVEAHKARSYYDMLCDLKSFETYLNPWKKPHDFFWVYDKEWGYTQILEFYPYEPCYHIAVDWEEHKIFIREVYHDGE